MSSGQRRKRAAEFSAEPLPTGLDALWYAAACKLRELRPRRNYYLRLAEQALCLLPALRDISEAALRDELVSLAVRFRRNRQSTADRVRATALIGEVVRRKIGLTLYLEQFAGGLALADGLFIEMATGEGKSITAVLPAVLEGWRGRGVHVVTVNDYLARRDAAQFAELYNFCGISVAYIHAEMDAVARAQAYAADVTYCTNKEVCADLLRDRLIARAAGNRRGHAGLGPAATGRVQRELHFAIVDEADSILIDEAVTPLIISTDQPNSEQLEAYHMANRLAERMRLGVHYQLVAADKTVEITGSGPNRIDELRHDLPGVWRSHRRSAELIGRALEAKHFYLPDVQYVVREGKVVIVDEFTGRLMPDRQWRDGLHQMVEARERVDVQGPRSTMARISFQQFFRGYPKLAGMSGTMAEVRSELMRTYGLPLVRIGPHRPCIRRREGTHLFADSESRTQAVLAEIQRVHAQGRPLLIGTRSVRASGDLSRRLTALGLGHVVLDALHHEQEAHIVAQAGQTAVITVATNMAGRGTDIQLSDDVRRRGGLHVIATECHEAPRIDRQLAGRAGRQGDPGSSIIFASLEDDLMRLRLARLSSLLRVLWRRRQPLPNLAGRLILRLAQFFASHRAVRQRRGVTLADQWLDETLGFTGAERTTGQMQGAVAVRGEKR